MYDVVVVGAGVNGLTAAARMVAAGRSVLVVERMDTVGGNGRTDELLVDGVRHDLGAAVVPFAAASPAFRELGLEIPFAHSPIVLAHPLDGGTAAALYRDVGATALGFGDDAGRYRRFVSPLVTHFAALATDVMAPQVKIPRHPLLMARFGAVAALPATTASRLAAVAGCDGRCSPGSPPTPPCHRIISSPQAWATRCCSRHMRSAGRSSRAARSASPKRSPRSSPTAAATSSSAPTSDRWLTCRAPRSHCSTSRRDSSPHWRQTLPRRIDGGGTAPVPARSTTCSTGRCRGPHRSATARRPSTWAAPRPTSSPPNARSRRANTPSARSCWSPNPTWPTPRAGTATSGRCGRTATCPTAATSTPARASNASSTGSHRAGATASSRSGCSPRDDSEATNPNLIGGDIAAGIMSIGQVLLGPRRRRAAISPYRTNLDGVFLCSSSCPPGPGIHGMPGWHAAGEALHDTSG